MQKIVRASLSSGNKSSTGESSRFLTPFGGVLPRLNGRAGGENERRRLEILTELASVALGAFNASAFLNVERNNFCVKREFEERTNSHERKGKFCDYCEIAF
jgi:hypothetical protein